MTNPIYEVISTPSGGTVINALYEDGRLLSIPSVEANSDYQAYLDRDKPKAEHFTPIVTDAD